MHISAGLFFYEEYDKPYYLASGNQTDSFSIPSSKLENVSNFQPTRLFQFELHKIKVKEPPWVKEKVEKSDKERDRAEMREREKRIEWERTRRKREIGYIGEDRDKENQNQIFPVIPY